MARDLDGNPVPRDDRSTAGMEHRSSQAAVDPDRTGTVRNTTAAQNRTSANRTAAAEPTPKRRDSEHHRCSADGGSDFNQESDATIPDNAGSSPFVALASRSRL